MKIVHAAAAASWLHSGLVVVVAVGGQMDEQLLLAEEHSES
jgi:hypothetical protein